MFDWVHHQIEAQRQDDEAKRLQREYDLILAQQAAQEITILERWALARPLPHGAGKGGK